MTVAIKPLNMLSEEGVFYCLVTLRFHKRKKCCATWTSSKWSKSVNIQVIKVNRGRVYPQASVPVQYETGVILVTLVLGCQYYLLETSFLTGWTGVTLDRLKFLNVPKKTDGTV